MKSAYELAMERLRASSGPEKTLSGKQKSAIAEIDKRYDAKIAEARLGFEQRLAGARPNERAALQEELVAELARLEGKRESEKESIWEEAGG